MPYTGVITGSKKWKYHELYCYYPKPLHPTGTFSHMSKVVLLYSSNIYIVVLTEFWFQKHLVSPGSFKIKMAVRFISQMDGYFPSCLWIDISDTFFSVFDATYKSKPFSFFPLFNSVVSWSVPHICMTCYILIHHLLLLKKIPVWKTGDT